jgi:hypothetical protein
MKSTIGNYIIPIAVGALALLIGFGVYSIFAGPTKDAQTKAEEARIKSELAIAEAKVEFETAKLNNMQVQVRDSNPFLSAIQGQLSNAQNILKGTDAVFIDTNTDNPKINVTTATKAIEKDINNRRAVINQLLADWEKKASLTSTKNVDEATVALIIKDAEKIKEFIAELSQIVSLLTPQNSGLSQAQIDSFVAVVNDASSQINNVIVALVDAQTPVTQTDIQTQQTVVDVAQQNANLLAEQLAQLQAQNQIPVVVAPEPAPEPTTTIVQEEIPPPLPPLPVIPTSGLIAPKGKPQLIQGANL